jgi:hypothetical protein
LFQADGGLNHKALDRLPDHIKGIRPLLERQKNIDGIFQSWEQANTLASKKALAPIPPDAPQTVRDERKALLDSISGVPKDVKDYGIARPADIPEAQWNQPLAENFGNWAHKHSVSPSAVKELLGVQIEAMKAQLGEQEKWTTQFYANEDKTFQATLQRENIPSDRAQALIEKGAMAFGLNLEDPQTAQFMKGALARQIVMRHALTTGEDKVITGGGTASEGRDYTAQALDIQRNPANPEYAIYRNVDGKYSRTQQQAVVERVNELHRLAAAKNGAKTRASR